MEDTFQEQEIHLKDYLRVLLRRKYIILLVLAVSLPVILIRFFSGEPIYQATAKLLIERSTPPALLSNYGFRYEPHFLDTQTQVIKSQKVGRQVVDMLNLTETHSQYFPEQDSGSLIGSVLGWVKSIFRVGRKLIGMGPKQTGDEVVLTEAEKKEMMAESLATMIGQGISVAQSGDEGNVVLVSFQSINPAFSANIVNSVAAAYKGVLLDMRSQSTGETLEWMQKKAILQREKLQTSEKALQEYKNEQGIYTVDDEEAMFPAKIAELSRRLTTVQAEVGEMESLYQEIRRISISQALNLPVVADTPTIMDLRKKILNQEQEISGLSKSIGEKHPRMIRAKKDLASLRTTLAAEVENVIQSIKNKYELAREQANSLEGLLQKTKQDAAQMGDKFIQYEILKRDVDVNNLLYERLISRIKEYDATDVSQPIDVWVVEAAAIPQYPINKRLKRTLMLGVLVSLMLGVGLAFFLEYLDNTVKTAEEVEARLNYPALGMIPFWTDDDCQMEKIVQQAPSSIIAENYKAIRTVILLSPDENKNRSVLISSMTQSTGKTVTATNLAIAFALSERRVLLIDADMRRPRVHEIFGVNNNEGLSSYLSGKEQIKPIQPDLDLPGLYIVPSGPIPDNPSELLSSPRLGKLLETIKKDYDFVFIDSPPILNVTDANLIAKVAHQTLIVVRSGVSTYDALRRMETMMQQINVSIMGYIVNAVSEKEQRYYGREYYGGYGVYGGYDHNKA